MSATPREGTSSNGLASERTDLGFERTYMAAERTLLAWVRTALSMIGFGFTIFKFFQFVRESSPGGSKMTSYGPRVLGLALVALGTVFMITATIHQMSYLRRLARDSGVSFRPSLAIAGSLSLIILGAITLFSLLLRIA